MTHKNSIVIIGAGHSGGQVAIALREQGFKGTIDLIGQESHLPYERPALSKTFLLDHSAAESLYFQNQGFYDDSEIIFHKATAQSINRQEKVIYLSNGRSLSYQKLCLANGGRRRELAIEGAKLPGVLGLRTINDALQLRARLKPGQHLVIIGGGFIGLELAASAIQLGLKVSLIQASEHLLARSVPLATAQKVQQVHQAKGVDFYMPCTPVKISQDAVGLGLQIELSDSSNLLADTIVVGVGIELNTELARLCGLKTNKGVLVNSYLQTSDPNIYAVGDIAQFPSSQGGHSTIQETWNNAQTQAQTVANNLMATQEPIKTHHQLSEHQAMAWFWSDQYEYQLQVMGEPSIATNFVTRVVSENSHIDFYFKNQEWVACSAWGRAAELTKDLKVIRTLFERRVALSPEKALDGNIKWKALLKN